MTLASNQLPIKSDYLAPDGSEIRLLVRAAGGSMCHCTLPPGHISLAVAHHSIEELWYFTQGLGQVWRKVGGREEETDVRPRASVAIPTGTHFQFRNTGHEPLCFICVSMPPWPGPSEAFRVGDHWHATAAP